MFEIYCQKLQEKKRCHAEQGKILFLVLILLALFSALFFAVMSSTNTGSGNIAKEDNMRKSVSLIQYPLELKTAIARLVDGGKDINEILFAVELPEGEENKGDYFFHAANGGHYIKFDKKYFSEGRAQDWVINQLVSVEGLGTEGADLIAFLSGIEGTLCADINQNAGIHLVQEDIPVLEDTDLRFYYSLNKGKTNLQGDETLEAPSMTTIPMIKTSEVNVFKERVYGCFKNQEPEEYVYYHVLHAM